MRKLQHDHVVQFIDLYTLGKSLYIVLEYMLHENVNIYMNEKPYVGAFCVEACEIALQVAKGVRNTQLCCELNQLMCDYICCPIITTDRVSQAHSLQEWHICTKTAWFTDI